MSDITIVGLMFAAVAAVEGVFWLLWLDELDRRWHEAELKKRKRGM